MMHVFAAATKASSGVITPAWPCASGGRRKVHLGAVAADKMPLVLALP